MAPREFDLNLVPDDWDLTDGIDSGDAILGDRDAHAHELDCDTVRDDGEPDDGDELEVHNQVDDDASCDAPSGGYTDPARARDANKHVLIGALERGDGTGDDGGSGEKKESNGKKKRRYYSDDFKIAIYLELLAKTDPMLHRGVSTRVAQKFGVPLRTVQSVWRKGQNYGIDGVKNKYKNCGRKRVDIDFEAIKDVPLSERTSFRKLANALGVDKSTLHDRFKEGYFVRTPNKVSSKGILSRS